MAVTPAIIRRGKRTLAAHQLQRRQQDSGSFSSSAVTIAVGISSQIPRSFANKP